MEMVTVRMLDTVEDSNEHPVLQDGSFVLDDASGKVRSEHRVEVLRAGQEYVLPEYQARNLIAKGFAEPA